MKRFNTLALAVTIVFVIVVSGSHLVMAQGVVNESGGPLTEENLSVTRPNADHLNEDHTAVQTWITKWYGPDGNYENNGGFNTSGPIDLMAVGTRDRITDVSLSTLEGLLLTQEVDDVEWGDDHGGTRAWTVFKIDPADGNNMNRGGPADNLDTYAVIVIDSPADMTSVMSPAQDDYAQIWINGEKWHNNATWTGGTYNVDYNIEVRLQKGANVLLFRCGEGGGSAYFNLHFDDATHEAVTIYPKDATDKASFFEEILPLTAVEASGKLATTWADIKRK
jgi:hypothetical protein